jgi:hypothetical protein
MQKVKKEYVSILAQIHMDGSIQPIGILLEDGRKYDIDEVKDKSRIIPTQSNLIPLLSCMILVWSE